MSDSVTQWTTAHQVSLPFIIFQSLLKLMSTELVLTSNHLVLCYLLLFLTSKFPGIRGFSNKPCGHSIGASVSASVLPMNIQCWFPLGLTGLVSLHPWDSQESSPMPQFKGINSSVFRFFFFFFIVQISHLYMTIRKNKALTLWILETGRSWVTIMNDHCP